MSVAATDWVFADQSLAQAAGAIQSARLGCDRQNLAEVARGLRLALDYMDHARGLLLAGAEGPTRTAEDGPDFDLMRKAEGEARLFRGVL